jgi:OmpA family
VLTPLGTFTGSATVIYQVIDELDRTAISTMKVTLDQIDLEAGHKTVDIEEPATLGVFGVPPDSTVTAPPTVAGAASVSLAGARVHVVPAPGFTGTITVPVTVTHGTATLHTEVIVYVRPAAVTGGSHHLVDAHTTTVRWTGSEGARWYEIHVNGVLRCRTVRSSCTMPRMLGPAAVVEVTAVGADELRSAAVRVPYHETACHGLGTVYFDTGSARLRADATATLDRLDRKLAAQGFTLGCLVGHTDSRGSVAYNLALSKRRVASVAAYVHEHVHGLTLVGHYSGELIPAAPNNTPAGRAANRRVELDVN